jgi:YD repeat-containing protein
MRLHETLVITENSGYLETLVTITDREGRYRGGSYQKRDRPAIRFMPSHDAQGRLSRVAYETPQGWFYEDYGYDARGGLISKIRRDAGGNIASELVWAHTYDAAGRLVMSVETHPRDTFEPWDNKQFFDTTGRLMYRLGWSGRANGVDQWDSTAYVYRPDGRLSERRVYRDGDSLHLVVRWEYKVWQVPVLGVRRKASAGIPYPAGYLGILRDARGRLLPGLPAHPLAVFGGLP